MIKEKQIKNIAILSCWFGYKFNKPLKIYSFSTCKKWLYATIKNHIPYRILNKLGFISIIPQAPNSVESCYFYSNNKSLKAEIIAKGWQFCFVETKVDNGESIASSLLAKKVKFLQMDAAIYKNLNHIIYMDSRRISDDIANIIHMNQKGILIRYEAKFKPTIWHEVEEAKGQDRYAKHMDITIDFINAKLSEGYCSNNRVMNTGIIAYDMDIEGKKIRSLCDEVYSACVKLQQPECQIFWCLLSQAYIDIIQAIEGYKLKSRSGL
ncbi:hypothetical protein [Thalassotalea profundi]|uniref:Uncharacterized protein n=1 Tax=Thalassotalea profundi TaxID=2036687 RepID=A0ABQ3IRH4_9GAMM|nr:hypothetical protein [Thalassotalea profundi]GHE89429.1 hypothetical protein GCM10011501_18720 [Thalassotalea profundi]